MAKKTLEALRHPLHFRILHEIIILMVFLLIITGFYIHRPFIPGGGFLMVSARGFHFICAGILIIAFILRIIGMFSGKHKDWHHFIPGASDFKLLPKVINYYAYFNKEEPELKKKYNPLQMMTYSISFILILFQIVSGFALQYPDGWLRWFNYGIFNNEVNTRIAHYIVLWIFVVFIIIHVYLAIRSNFGEIKEMHLLSSPDVEETAKE